MKGKPQLNPSELTQLGFHKMPGAHAQTVRRMVEDCFAEAMQTYPNATRKAALQLALANFLNNFYLHMPEMGYRTHTLADFDRNAQPGAGSDEMRGRMTENARRFRQIHQAIDEAFKSTPQFNMGKWLEEFREHEHGAVGLVGNELPPRMQNRRRLWPIFAKVLHKTELLNDLGVYSP